MIVLIDTHADLPRLIHTQTDKHTHTTAQATHAQNPHISVVNVIKCMYEMFLLEILTVGN